ncbi:hypothetical protein AB0E01_10595 [Nocardia vinacea]|uniref:phage tail protein n=1 Tax=Nocardia vinacea TaxID=96468 RepID=UPI00340F1202
MPEPARKSKPPRPPHNPATPVRTVGTANAMQRLQATAGNGAVAALFAQRLSAGEGASACLPPTVAPTPMTPKQDPKFAAATDQVAAESAAAKAHPAPAKEVKAAQDAAVAPADDKDAQAKAAHTATMAAAKPAGFDKAGFIAAVNAAIAAKAPKNLDEADKFATSGKADQVKNEVLGKVGAGKEASAKNVADTTKATPDTSVAKDKPVTAMPAAPPARQPVAPDPAAAAPKPAPAEQVQLGAGSCETNAKMAEAGVTDEQLAKSNEPEFTGALDTKKELQAHDAAAPAQFRQQEAATLAAAKDQAGASTKTGLAAMGSAKSASLQATGAGKDATKAKDEAERARITGEIKKIFDATKTEVEQILTGLDGLVAQKFEEGERKAKEAFTADHKERMWQYKLRRYGGPLGPTLWVKDLFLDMPAEANNLFLESKKLYESKMSAVISDIADTVGTELNRAKERIARGRTQVQKFVAEQPANLQKLAGQAVDEIGSQFADLEKSVDEKQQSLVDDLATRYSEARDGIDEEIKKLQDENKGLVGKTIDAVGGAIETIKKLKDMLLGVLARAAGAVEKIIKDPIAFLGNFVNAVKAGISNFMSNIGTHLKKGLQGWLFGALAEAGIEIPAKFDLKGIITLLLSLLGLTWNSIRARIVKVVGEPAMQKIEGAVDFVKAIVTEGIPGLWKWIAQKITDLKEQVMGQIREFVISKVITAGITWLISLLNPAAAFVKACKMIYDAVMWFVDNAERLKEFVDSVLDSVESIASGGVGKVAALIEGTLAKTVPMLISGLASLLGLGGIADKTKKILETVQKPVGQVVDKLIGVAVKYGKKFLGKLKNSKLGKFATGLEEKGKAAYAKGKAYVKAKYEAGKKWVKEKVDTVKAKVTRPKSDKSKETGKDTDPAAAARTVADAAKTAAGSRDAVATVKRHITTEGNKHLGGGGTISVTGLPTVQRTSAVVSEAPVSAGPDPEQVRSSQPTNPDVAAKILTFIQSRMQGLLAEFAKSDRSKEIRQRLDAGASEFRAFMSGKSDKALTEEERQHALEILGPARELSRKGYYNAFRDFAWAKLNNDKALIELVGTPGSKARLGGQDKALRIEVEVRTADGRNLPPEYRTVDFEHLTRVVDQPFKAHSTAEGKLPNLSPMLAEANRYFNEAIRDAQGAHMFGADEIERFIIQHQLYTPRSPARRDIEFKPQG